MTLPMFWSYKVLSESSPTKNFYVLLAFHLPSFVIGKLVFKWIRIWRFTLFIGIIILSDWIELVVYSFGKSIFIGILHYMFAKDPDFSFSGFMRNSVKEIIIYAFIFGTLEKIKKEKFVINITNSKTKKILL